MKYYLIRQDKRIKNAVIPQINNLKGIWKSDAPFFQSVKVRNLNGYPYFLPLLEASVYIVSDKMKKVFEIYQNKMLYRPCALGLLETKSIKVYWLMQPRIIDCLEERIKDNILYSDQDIVLCRAKIGYNKLFQIDTKVGNYLVIDEEVLESLLRAGITAFEWNELQAV